MAYKVSVIVPIYKVEKYIHRCLDSIVNQTYSNLEIILVNDGSPDNCGNIAEHYQENDARVKVIHKKNGGLSDARNVGVKHVTGECTMFVDSDDWLELNTIEKMVNTLIAYKADAVQSAFYYAYEDYLLYDNRYHSRSDSPVILNKKKLMTELVINERVKNFAWGKLYRTSLIKDIPFVKGVLFEDVFWAHQVMHQINTYVILHEPMFYYRQRSDSIVAAYSPKNLDIIKGLKERHSFIEKHYKDLINESYKIIAKTSLQHYYLLQTNRKKDRDGFYKKDLQTYIQKNKDILIRAVEEDKELRKQLYMFTINPYVNLLYLLSRKILRRLRITPQPTGLEKVVL